MTPIERAAKAIATILIREGIDYGQSKAVIKRARTQAGLVATPERRGSIDRLSLEEELAFIDEAFQAGGTTGLLLQTLLETGLRVSEFTRLRIEDVSLAERVVTVVRGKGAKLHGVEIAADALGRLKGLAGAGNARLRGTETPEVSPSDGVNRVGRGSTDAR